LAKDPWVQTLGKPYIQVIRRKDPYIEQIGFQEFQELPWGLREFPRIAIKIIKDILNIDIEYELSENKKEPEELEEERRKLANRLKECYNEYNPNVCKKIMRAFIAMSANKAD
jgi:hypothetical protein